MFTYITSRSAKLVPLSRKIVLFEMDDCTSSLWLFADDWPKPSQFLPSLVAARRSTLTLVRPLSFLIALSGLIFRQSIFSEATGVRKTDFRYPARGRVLFVKCFYDWSTILLFKQFRNFSLTFRQVVKKKKRFGNFFLVMFRYWLLFKISRIHK